MFVKNFSETDPIPLHVDNTSAIQITANPVYHEHTKHIEVDCHSIHEAFEARVITLPHISTDLQIADIFTKALPRHRHCLLIRFFETDPTPLHADNTSAIQIMANPVYHERTKHIEVDCHSSCEAFETRVITLPHISTDLQISDIFTKALPRHRHCLLSSKLMLIDQPASI
ncbi:Copia protein [Vitis vinifera]|uniref:Copia protein n=1 Tax=Vitis vinifera TaxID=29760 RepID=A0A438CEM3_VITVI|nr:Copia protein [Vitis vinifera]